MQLCHVILLCCIQSRLVMSFMSCHVMSCHVMSCHVMSFQVISCHVISYHIISCYMLHVSCYMLYSSIRCPRRHSSRRRSDVTSHIHSYRIHSSQASSD